VIENRPPRPRVDGPDRGVVNGLWIVNTHDIGFLFWPSFALGADITGDLTLREVALLAARTLA